jgi:hypothetical protein
MAVVHDGMLLSLVFSAYGYALQRPWAIVLTYAQLPFRFTFTTFSFGFLFSIPGVPLTWPIFLVVGSLEVFRTAITCGIHMNLIRPPIAAQFCKAAPGDT